jgi:hypothetical protein
MTAVSLSNDDIDEDCRSRGFLTDTEILEAQKDLEQAIWNRVKVALIMEGWVPGDASRPPSV